MKIIYVCKKNAIKIFFFTVGCEINIILCSIVIKILPKYFA